MQRIWFAMAMSVAVAAGCGDQGRVGPEGPAGPAGPAGTNGTNGSDGLNGSNGSNGSNGNDVIISDRAKHGLDVSPVAIDTTGMTSAQIEAIGQGSYLVNAVADCGGCHGEAGTTPGFLAGTTAMGATNARNLTPDATTGMKLTQAQFVDVMRTGTNYTCDVNGCTAGNTTLKIMPWNDYRWASTPDLEAIYAYLKAIPAVSNAVHADTTAGPAPVAFGTSFTDGDVPRTLPLELDANNNPIPDPDGIRRGMAIQPLAAVTSADATTEAHIGRGSYLVNSLAHCSACHTNPARDTSTGKISTAVWLTGGHIFNITGVVRSISADLVGSAHGFFTEPTTDFTTFEGILQTGMHIDDPTPSPLLPPMPWQHLRLMTVDDLAAVYTYLHAVSVTGDLVLQDPSFYCAANTDCTGAGETCDLDNTHVTYHECIGRACTASSDCRVCQTCGGTSTCGAPFSNTSPTCKTL